VVLQEFLRAHYTWFSMRLGHWGEAGRLAQECVNQLRSREAWPELAAVLHMAGVALWGTGRYAEARELLEEKIALEEQSGHPWDLAMGWGQLGLIVQGMGDYYNAREYMGRADKFIRECGDTRMLAVSLYHRAGVEFDLGELEAARQMLVQSLELSTVVGDRWIMCTSRLQLGLIAQAQGDHEEAVDWFLDSMGFFRETGEYRSKVQASTALGASLLALGDVEGADRALREALTSAFEAELWPETLAGLVAFAGLQANKGDDAGALVTLEQATRHPACSPATRDQMVNLRSESEARLTSQQMQEVLARAEGEPFDAYVRKLLETAE
jgi:tetratricopeptide (TPR) repeat protein